MNILAAFILSFLFICFLASCALLGWMAGWAFYKLAEIFEEK